VNAFLPAWDAFEERPRGHGSSAGDEPVPSDGFRASALLDVRGLRISRGARTDAPVLAEGVSLSVARGEVLGLVGVPGSGATEIALAIAGLLSAPAVIRSGSILLDGEELLGASKRRLARLRGTKIAFVPSVVTPRWGPENTVGRRLVGLLRSTQGLSHPAAERRARELLERVGVTDPLRTSALRPKQLDAVTRRQVLIAGAVSGSPELLILDEPTATLDAAERPPLLELFRSLRRDCELSIIVVSRDLGVVAATCDRVAVLDAGRIVEQGSAAEVVAAPQHPQTRVLLEAARIGPA
jgi:peptide/nickel transport system ATP-binding protein